MKVASVEWPKSEWKRIDKPKTLVHKIEEYLEKAIKEQFDIIVFPGFTGCFFQRLSYPDRGENNWALQVSGMWQEVQQNQFFAVESGFNGFLARSKGQQGLIIAELDNKKRKKVISKFDVLSQLNREFYQQGFLCSKAD